MECGERKEKQEEDHQDESGKMEDEKGEEKEAGSTEENAEIDNEEGIDEEWMEEEEEEEEDAGDNDDDDEGWITPSNIKTVMRQMEGGYAETERKQVTVACLTTDFAMQVSGQLHFFSV
jgi:RNA-binding protein NOB1